MFIAHKEHHVFNRYSNPATHAMPAPRGHMSAWSAGDSEGHPPGA